MVRPRSATPLSAGSNPACTSKTNRTLLVSVPFVLVGQSPNFETVLQTVGVAESGSHIPLGDRRARSTDIECGYLRHRRIPGSILQNTPCECPFCFGGVGRTLCRPSAVRSTRNPVHICRAERVAKRRESIRKQLSVVFPRA